MNITSEFPPSIFFKVGFCETFAYLIKTFNHADILGRGVNRVVFNIGGNSYRLICKYFFGRTMVHLFVVWVGTHAEYDKLCGEQKQYDVNMFLEKGDLWKD